MDVLITAYLALVPLEVFSRRRRQFLRIPYEGIMLIRYSCKDMGLNCPYILKGTTLEEVTEKALAHVREKHQEDFNIISSPAQIEEMRKALARSTRVVVG
jgi:predicted small metal-binding protein